jgi:hypothetical protein
MTNLEYLAWFLEETFGAICFHNEIEDGYVEFPNENKEIETLAVYFPNELDLMDSEATERLIRKAGKEFFRRYVGARNVRLCPVYGNLLFTAYRLNNETIYIQGESFFCGPTGLGFIIDYFLGRDISYRTVGKDAPKVELKGNNGFQLKIGDDILLTLKKFLLEQKKKLIGISDFYKSPYNYTGEFLNKEKRITELTKEFGCVVVNSSKLAGERQEKFRETLKYMSEEDWDIFFKVIGKERRKEDDE